MKVTDKYILFWKNWLSNFHYCKITDTFVDFGELTFFCAEQYFMYIKALTFNDHQVANKILYCTKPDEAKELGRQVRNYDNKIWSKIREKVMYRANFLKYTQNQELKEKLLNPDWKDKRFVEANPYDKIWAIGLSEDDPRALNQKTWLGENLFGKVLDDVRAQILINENSFN